MAVDGKGNVYVAGLSEGRTTDPDYVTIKYDSRGRQAWVARYDGPGNGRDLAYAIAVDAESNVYVTGTSEAAKSSLTGYDFATIKYGKDGERLWTARYDNQHRYDAGNKIVMDARGSVYVTGTSAAERPSGGVPEYVTIKYDNNGNQLWAARAKAASKTFGGILPSHMALDSAGNVYVAGSDWQSTGRDYLVVKYDTNGNQLWRTTYNGPHNGDDGITGLAVDRDGAVVVTGASYGRVIASDVVSYDVFDDIATVKYDSEGRELWVARYNGPDNSTDYARAVAVDGKGDIYVAGRAHGPTIVSGPITSTGYFDAVTIKYSSRGQQQWIARCSGGADDALAGGVSVDGKGNIYVTMDTSTLNRQQVALTLKYDSRGRELWVLNHGMSVESVIVDQNGNIYALGSKITPETKMDIVVVRYPAR